MGVQPHDRVGLISENRLEWNLMDFAIQQIGAVVVAIYPNISDVDYAYILPHAEVKWCFVSNDKLYYRLKSINQNVSILQKVFTFQQYDGIPNWKEVIDGGNGIALLI